MTEYNKETLTEDFILELFNTAFKKDDVFELILEHLKFSYLSHEYEKKFWKQCVTDYTLNKKIPSIGVLQSEFRKENEVRNFIADIKKSETKDIADLIEKFQTYIKESKFVEVYESAAEYYNRNEFNSAFKIFSEGSDYISNFSIKDKTFSKVFEGFEERQIKRRSQERKSKIPFFIDKIDEFTKGGAEAGEIVLAMAESGIGKTQWLYHWAISAARYGKKVLLIQIEGTERQAQDRLDSAWTGILYHDIKLGNFGKSKDDEEKERKLKNILKKIPGEIYIEASEKYGSINDLDLRNLIKDAKKLYGDIDLVLVDYLELMSVVGEDKYGPAFERHRQQKIGRAMKEIAMEEMLVLGTVTQASNLTSELKKNPNFVMTREYLSEDKGKIRPFDFFFTFNQTYDEMKYRDETGILRPIIRIYIDKARDYWSGQTITIVTSFKNSRFYDRKNTINLVLSENEE
jgi:hypothetical protein